MTVKLGPGAHGPAALSLVVEAPRRGQGASSRSPCCVLLALSWNTNEYPSTDKLSRAINYSLMHPKVKTTEKIIFSQNRPLRTADGFSYAP